MVRNNDTGSRIERRGYQPGFDRGYQPQVDDGETNSSDEPRDIQNLKLPKGDTAVQPPRSETSKPTK